MRTFTYEKLVRPSVVAGSQVRLPAWDQLLHVNKATAASKTMQPKVGESLLPEKTVLAHSPPLHSFAYNTSSYALSPWEPVHLGSDADVKAPVSCFTHGSDHL